jgi:hypothetical protein
MSRKIQLTLLIRLVAVVEINDLAKLELIDLDSCSAHTKFLLLR